MNILVTGGTGFTGSALVLRLIENGHKVRSLDYQKGICSEELMNAGAEMITGSITDADLVDRSTEGMDVVFHLAAAFRELDVPDSHYYDVNVNGTRHVMESAVKHKLTKVVYCSTQGVHGHIQSPPGNENSPIAPADYYQETKYLGEKVVNEFSQSTILSTIIRPTAIYGPGDPGRFLMIYKWAKKGFFPMFGSGRTYYHPVYIDNLVDAFMLSMDFKTGNGETYIIADDQYFSIKELVVKTGSAMGLNIKVVHMPLLPLIIAGHICEKACKPFGIAPPIFPRRVDWFRQVRAFNIDKAKRELQYEPGIGIDEGLKRTAGWYLSEGYLN